MNDIKKGVDEIAAGGADASRSRLARST